jgi:7-keto-8-aminopelargonate synthetase-like enzyme
VTKHALGTAGLPILYSLSHIVPVMVGHADRCNAASLHYAREVGEYGLKV